MQREQDVRGAEPGLAAPGGDSSCGRGRTSGRGGEEPPSNDSCGAGAEHPTARANDERSRAELTPCPSVPAARRRSTSVRDSFSPVPPPAPATPVLPVLGAADSRGVPPPCTPVLCLPGMPWMAP